MGVPGVSGVFEVSEGVRRDSITKGKYPIGPWRMGQGGVLWSAIILSGVPGGWQGEVYGAVG